MTLGVLPFEDLKKKVHLTTGFFETSQYTEDAQMYITSGNHDNAGLSVGNLQYNFGPADRAQEWFKYMIDNHVSIVDAAFGANTTELATFKNVINTYTRADRITWGDSISALVNGEKRALIPPYKDAFGTMLISAEGKAKYYSMKDMYYWTPSYELFRHLSCKSRAALASLFDTYVNKGRYYPVNALVADFDAIDANAALTEAEKEAQKIYQINWRGNYTNAVKPTPNAWDGSIDQNIFWHGDGVDDGRRGCMANQEGVYYGAVYDPETQFDLNQEPATDEKVGAAPINVNLGNVAVDNIFLGNTQISKLYLGATLIGGGEISTVTSNRVPTTQFRTNAGSYAGIADQTAVSLTAGQPLWIDVQEPFVGCRTYYTTDGTEPTAASNLYNNPLTFDTSTTLKVKTISVFGVAAATKTLAVTVAAASVTSISPTATTQNTIPITVTLTNNQGNTIYYRVGTGTQQTYTGPFSVNQSNAGVQSTNITVYYWSTGEAEKSITYNTSGAIAGKAVVTATPASWYVSVDWNATANATSYNVYRSTTAGILGDLLSEFNTGLHYDDNTPVNGTTYYYTVRAANYGGAGPNSDQVAATPNAAPSGWRYLKIEGYGSVQEATTTRIIEFEAWEGATNWMVYAGFLGNEAINAGNTDVTSIRDTIKTTSGYPIWWNATPNAHVIIDLGAQRALTKLNYYSYSTASVPRTNRFKILASNTNNGADWVAIWDNSTGQAGVQPVLPSGYEKIL
jgi:hypothetical protein